MIAISERLAEMGREMPVQETPCPACLETRFSHAIVRNGFPVVRCKGCGSLYARLRPREEYLPKIYQRFPQLSNGQEGQLTDDPENARKEADYRLRHLLQFARSGILLDLGCGRGDFLNLARGYFDAHGVDTAPRLRRDFETIDVFAGRLEDASFPDESFNVVTAVEVLEHVFDLRKVFQEIHRILKPRGIFLFQIGDVDSLRARLNLKTWTYLQPPVHLNFLSRDALRRLSEELGFERLKSWSFGRAPAKIPFFGRVLRVEPLRFALDLAARGGLIGEMYAWRKNEPT